MPESMAAHMLGEETLWGAGARVMQSGDPEAWQALTDAVDMLGNNLQIITRCEEEAAEAKRALECVIKVQ